MAVECTERWSGRRLTQGVNLQWTAERKFDVAYASNARDAVNAVAQQMGVYLNAPHDLTPLLKCSSVDVVLPGFTVYAVTAQYGVPPAGDYIGAGEDPLRIPAQVNWVPGLQSEPVDIDAYRNPILNMAGEPVGPFNLDKESLLLTVERNEPFYDPNRIAPYLNRVNADTFLIRGSRGALIVRPGMCRCKSIAPTKPYVIGGRYVPVRYLFELLPDTGSPSTPGDGHDLRIPNRGTFGWYTDSDGAKKMGPLYYKSASDKLEAVTAPVALDRLGRPQDPNIVVTRLGKTAGPNTGNTATPSAGQMASFVRFEASPTGQIYLHYRKCKRVSFSGLL